VNRHEANETQHSKLVVTPEMVEAGARVFAMELPEVEEAMRNVETKALVSQIYIAMSAKVEGRAHLV
jgi:hypothetical protein